ncbi:MAG: radical SAM protein [Candidatus Woesebacteria bacterium]|nr:MAG: radical SAM protein [Candidatus Woesebacteria bacterium]
MVENLKARGTGVMLPHGGLPEVLPPYLVKLISETGGPEGPIGLQFVARPTLELSQYDYKESDPLLEDFNEVSPGLVYKYRAGKDSEGHSYAGRALFTITRNCAAYCRYCTRGREVGIPANQQGELSGTLSHTPHLSKEQIDQSLEFIRNEYGLNEVILSGGDPLTVRPEVLSYVTEKLGEMQREGKLSIVRIGTRVPIHNPLLIKEAHFEALKKLRNPRFMIHANHILELTPEALSVLQRLRKDCNGVVMSQTVLLKGVNDNVEVLYNLFTKWAEEGFIPYYVFQNDAVSWAKHFTVPIQDAISLWQKMRPRLSGVAATARFVIDVESGYGKVAVPEAGAWNIIFSDGFRDFKGTRFDLGVAE